MSCIPGSPGCFHPSDRLRLPRKAPQWRALSHPSVEVPTYPRPGCPLICRRREARVAPRRPRDCAPQGLAVVGYRGVMETVTIPTLHAMKRDGRKIVGVVAWDYQIAQIVDRAGVDIVSVGDSVGVNLWGQPHPLEVTMEEMIVVCKAVRRGVRRALVSCDFPFGPLQEGPESAVRAAIRLVKEAGADMVKLDGAVDFPEAVHAVTRAGIPVFAQFGITPQTALQYGIP